MKISRHELDQLIEEEINEIFGFGKKAPSKEYPASELAILIKGLDDASEMSGAKLSPSQREAIVDELMGVLEDQGFVVKENERLYTGEKDVVVTHQDAPKLMASLDTIAQKSPKVFKQLLGLFNRSALDISPVVKDIIPSITTVAEPEPDEDQTATIKAEPVAAPDEPDEDQTATIKAEPVAAPDEDEEDSKWDGTLDKIQAGLDLAGLAGLTVAGEVVGTPATLASLALNTARGKYPMALLDVIALVPVVGKMAKAGKLGKAAKVGAAAAKWKTGRALIGTLGSARAARAATTGASSAVKSAIAAKQLGQGASGIVEILPDALLKQVVLAKTDEGEPWVDHAIDTVGELPLPGLGLEEKAAKLRELWADVKKEYLANAPRELGKAGEKLKRRAPDQIGPLKEHRELDRMKVLAGIK